jgi:hypothetical protein
VKSTPILMSGPLVRPTLDGRKTQTRRLVRNPGGWRLANPSVGPHGATIGCYHTSPPHFYAEQDIASPWAPRETLYVRESATVLEVGTIGLRIRYEADGAEAVVPWPDRIKEPTVGHKLANGTYREASRLTLRVTSVRVERLQETTEEDARAEGVVVGTQHLPETTHREAFADLWDSLAPEGAKWTDNPWVWVISFARDTTNPRSL